MTDPKIEFLWGEIWAHIPQNYGYLISNYGRVYNCARKILLKVMEVNRKNGFYLRVKLGSKTTINIHTTIAKAFIPNPRNDTQIVFLDGDRTNVQLGNIQWKSLYRRDAFIINLQNDSSYLAFSLLKFINGDPQYLDTLIAEEYTSLQKTAYHQLNKCTDYSYKFDSDMANVALQEGLLKGLLALKRGMLNDISNFFGWLAQIIRNTAKNLIKFEWRYVSENQTTTDGSEFSIIDRVLLKV